jgi:hypothetical protein
MQVMNEPSNLATERHYNWKVERGARRNFARFGHALSLSNPKLFRRDEGDGLLLVLPSGETRLITKGTQLAPVIVDSLHMKVTKEGKVTGELPPAGHLSAMLASEEFLSSFRPVTQVLRRPAYLQDFRLTEPGYSVDGRSSYLYVGSEPRITSSLDTINQFLDVMDFASEADRTNTVAAALTSLLNNHWPGEKPVVLVTATKSHSGKGTVTDFIRGTLPKADILYESIDWPMQSQFQKQIRLNPEVGFVCFDNVRLDSAGGRAKTIRSAFVESFVTNPEIMLASPGAGEAVRIKNSYVVSINTNDGGLSADLLNRSLPIHLTPKGNVHDRVSPIGNPKLEFLPQNRDRIEAELRGMIERWKEAGYPTDDQVKHPMGPWAKTIGGILAANGFKQFLDNYSAKRISDDPIRDALSILAGVAPDKALRPAEWAKHAVVQGLAKTLFSAGDRDTEEGRARAIGVLFSRYAGESFETRTDLEQLVVCLEGGNRRWTTGKNPHVRYVFRVLQNQPLPVEE